MGRNCFQLCLSVHKEGVPHVTTHESFQTCSHRASGKLPSTEILSCLILHLETWSRNVQYKSINTKCHDFIMSRNETSPQLRWQFYHWLLLCTLGLNIVNVQWCRNSTHFLTIFTFWIWLGIKHITCHQRTIPSSPPNIYTIHKLQSQKTSVT